MGVFTAIVWFVLTFTMVGRRVYAVGGNPEAARLSGINVMRYKLMAFVFCSGAAGLAGHSVREPTAVHQSRWPSRCGTDRHRGGNPGRHVAVWGSGKRRSRHLRAPCCSILSRMDSTS